MITYEEAKELALNWILKNKSDMHKPRFDVTENRINGWIFYYEAPNELKSYSNFPIYIDKHTGNIIVLNSFFMEEIISKYESEQGYI